MLKTLRGGDAASGIFLIIIGAITLAASMTIAEGAGGRLHPRTLPVAIGALLVIGGAWLIVYARRPQYRDKEIDWPDRAGWRNWGVALVMMALYAALMPVLGFILTTFIFVVAFIGYFGEFKFWVALAWGFGTVAFIYLLFIRLLQMEFPAGVFAL